jgi:hypothetical protein
VRAQGPACGWRAPRAPLLVNTEQKDRECGRGGGKPQQKGPESGGKGQKPCEWAILKTILTERGIPAPALTATRLLRDNGIEEAVEGLKFALALAVEEARHRYRMAEDHEEVWHGLTERIYNHGTCTNDAVAVGGSAPGIGKEYGMHDSARSPATRHMRTATQAPQHAPAVRLGTASAPRFHGEPLEPQVDTPLQTPRVPLARASGSAERSTNLTSGAAIFQPVGAEAVNRASVETPARGRVQARPVPAPPKIKVDKNLLVGFRTKQRRTIYLMSNILRIAKGPMRIR